MKPVECLFKGIELEKSMHDVTSIDDITILYDNMIREKFAFTHQNIIEAIECNTDTIPAEVLVHFFHMYASNESQCDGLLNIILRLGKDIVMLGHDIFYTNFSYNADLYPLFKLIAMHYDETDFRYMYNYYSTPTKNDLDTMTLKDQLMLSYVQHEDIYSFISLTKPYIKQFLDEWVGVMASQYTKDWYKVY